MKNHYIDPFSEATKNLAYMLFDDGQKAADYLSSDHSFDLALLDIMLPGIDGFELFSHMEKYNIPVIYMTAKTDSASEVKGLRDGAEDYIVKPFEVTMMRQLFILPVMVIHTPAASMSTMLMKCQRKIRQL